MKTPLHLLLLLLLPLLISGCNDGSVRVSKDQAQAVADSKAGLDACVQVLRDMQRAGKDVGHALLLAASSQSFLVAALANLPAPLPEATVPAKLLVEPGPIANGYAEAARVAEANPPKGVDPLTLGALGAGALALLGWGLRIGRNLPGVGGMACSLANMVYEAWAPDKVKQKEDGINKAKDLAVQYGHAITLIAAQDPRMNAMVERVKEHTTDLAKRLGVEGVVNAALAEAKLGNPLLTRVPLAVEPKAEQSQDNQG